MTRKAALAVDIGPFFSPAEVAKMIGCPERTVRQTARKLQACSILGKTTIISGKDLERILSYHGAAMIPSRQMEERAENEARQRARNRLPPKHGHVYFVAGEGRVKIGYAKSTKKRVEAIQTYCPFKIELLLSYRAPFKHEQELHRRFRADHLIGEWFTLSPAILAYISGRKK